jgi:hypothetical protein
MSETIFVQYVGFKAKPLVREYSFTVRESATEPRDFTLTIANEAFDSRRARYQDAPDICSLKLRRELTTYANNPPKNHFRISDAELEDYRIAHSPKSTRPLYARKTPQDF